MARLVHRETGSTIDVPEEKVARLYGMGYSPEESAPAKPAAKKAAAKSEK